MITVLADQNHYLLEQYLHPSIRLDSYDPIAGWTDEQIRSADALLVRTVNPVNRDTLPESSSVRFVGSASAGRDHLDDEWLASRNIHVADAKGSNARCVAEHVAVSVLSYCESAHRDPRQLTAGIVGVGQTGSATAAILQGLGVHCLLFDPPRERRERNGESETPVGGRPFVSVSPDEVLSADILTFHVPLVHNGTDATRHWYDREKIRSTGKILVINASRGGVVDETELRKAAGDGHVAGFILDVWENEPLFDDESVKQAFLATPHVAGYSIEAKRKATEMMCRELHRFFGLDDPEPPSDPPKSVSVTGSGSSLTGILKQLHPAWTYDTSLRALTGTPPSEKGSAFLELRQKTPLRHEFQQMTIPEALTQQHPELLHLGLQTGP